MTTSLTAIGQQLAGIADRVELERDLTGKAKSETLNALAIYEKGVTESYDKMIADMQAHKATFQQATKEIASAVADEYDARQAALAEVISVQEVDGERNPLDLVAA